MSKQQLMPPTVEEGVDVDEDEQLALALAMSAEMGNSQMKDGTLDQKN